MKTKHTHWCQENESWNLHRGNQIRRDGENGSITNVGKTNLCGYTTNVQNISRTPRFYLVTKLNPHESHYWFPLLNLYQPPTPPIPLLHPFVIILHLFVAPFSNPSMGTRLHHCPGPLCCLFSLYTFIVTFHAPWTTGSGMFHRSLLSVVHILLETGRIRGREWTLKAGNLFAQREPLACICNSVKTPHSYYEHCVPWRRKSLVSRIATVNCKDYLSPGLRVYNCLAVSFFRSEGCSYDYGIIM